MLIGQFPKVKVPRLNVETNVFGLNSMSTAYTHHRDKSFLFFCFLNCNIHIGWIPVSLLTLSSELPKTLTVMKQLLMKSIYASEVFKRSELRA